MKNLFCIYYVSGWVIHLLCFTQILNVISKSLTFEMIFSKISKVLCLLLYYKLLLVLTLPLMSIQKVGYHPSTGLMALASLLIPEESTCTIFMWRIEIKYKQSQTKHLAKVFFYLITFLIFRIDFIIIFNRNSPNFKSLKKNTNPRF